MKKSIKKAASKRQPKVTRIQIIACSTRSRHNVQPIDLRWERYECLKAEWNELHPDATAVQRHLAMQNIANECGV